MPIPGCLSEGLSTIALECEKKKRVWRQSGKPPSPPQEPEYVHNTLLRTIPAY